VSIELELLNTPQGGSHPAHIHLNNAAGGDMPNIKSQLMELLEKVQQHLKLLIMVVLSRIKRYLILTDI
jgi:hypothetical protein